jgi:hypothetical protein
MAWVALPGAYAPASIALQIRACKPPLHDKGVVLGEDLIYFRAQKYSFVNRTMSYAQNGPTKRKGGRRYE